MQLYKIFIDFTVLHVGHLNPHISLTKQQPFWRSLGPALLPGQKNHRSEYTMVFKSQQQGRTQWLLNGSFWPLLGSWLQRQQGTWRKMCRMHIIIQQCYPINHLVEPFYPMLYLIKTQRWFVHYSICGQKTSIGQQLRNDSNSRYKRKEKQMCQGQ